MGNKERVSRISIQVLFGTVLLASLGQQHFVEASGTSGVEEINELLKDTQLAIPGEFSISRPIGFLNANLDIQNVLCSNISVGDVIISHERPNDQVTDMKLELAHFGLQCDMDYQYKYGFISGNGRLDMTADDSYASTAITFESQDFNAYPPASSTAGDCVANIEITAIDFQGDFLSELLELFEGPVSNIIEGELENFLCTELESLDLNNGDEDIIGDIANGFDPYLPPLTQEEEQNPLLVEDSLDIPADMTILDLQNTTNGSSKLLNQTLTLLAEVLSGETNGTLDVNGFLRSSLLEDDGCLTLNFTQLEEKTTLFDTHNDLVELFIAMEKIQVCGLDSLEKFNVLVPNGKHTLRNEMFWRRLSLHLAFSIDTLPSSLDTAIFTGPTSSGVKESIFLDVALENVDVVASLLLAIKEAEMSPLTLGGLLRMDNFWECALNVFHTVQVSGLRVNPDLIDSLSYNLTTDGSAGFTSLLGETLDSVYSLYDGVLNTTIEAIFQRGIAAELNAIIDDFLSSAGGTAGESVRSLAAVSEPIVEYVDFRELLGSGSSSYSTIPRIARDLLNGYLIGSEQFNNLLSLFLPEDEYDGNGNYILNGSLLNTTATLAIGGLVADLDLQLQDAQIQNLNSLGQPSELLKIVQDHPHLLANAATLGTEPIPLQMTVNLYFSLAGLDNVELKNNMTITVAMNAITLEPLLLLMIEASRINSFPIQNVLELNCWLATIPAPKLDRYGVSESTTGPTASLRGLAASIASLTMNVTCNECSSPKLIEWPKVLASPDAQADLTAAMENVITYVGEVVSGGALWQNMIDQTLNDAARQCPHDPAYAPDSNATTYEVIPITPADDSATNSFLATLSIIALCGILMVVALGFALRWFVKRRHRTRLATLPLDSLAQLVSDQQEEMKARLRLDVATQSMFTSPQVPLLVRFGMPVVILMNIAFFLSGHLSLGASVVIEANIVGEQFRVDKFFDFSMARSIVDLWDAGGKALAVILLIFSGIWPYTKQLTTLVLWFSPPTKLSTSRRESILLWLDRFGKWSMIDIFILVIMIVGFRVSVKSPDASYLPPDFYSIDLVVNPMWGLYANMTAQLISQVSSHFIIYYHREIIREGNARLTEDTNTIEDGETSSRSEQAAEDSSQKISLYQHQFHRMHRGDKAKLVVRNWVNKILVLVAVSIAAFVIAGCSISSFSLENFGIIGVAVESGQGFDDATVDHSVFTVLKLLFDGLAFFGGAADFVGAGVLSALLVLTILVVPVVEAIVLSIQWFSKSTDQRKMKLSVLIEILEAWQYTEVYLISLMLGSWQLGPLSELLINEYCGGLEATFRDLVSAGFLKEEDGQCFLVKSTLKAGFWIILAGSLFLAFFSSFVTKALSQFLWDKKEAAKKEKRSIEGAETSGAETSDTNIDNIRPVPVLFSDSFRWMLKSQ